MAAPATTTTVAPIAIHFRDARATDGAGDRVRVVGGFVTALGGRVRVVGGFATARGGRATAAGGPVTMPGGEGAGFESTTGS